MPTKGASSKSVTVLGAGIQGTSVALCLAERGHHVVLIDREAQAMSKASLWNEGKIHLGFLFANDTASRTARTMMDGAQTFLTVLSRFISAKDIVSRRSKPFVYAIPHDSLLSVDAIEQHFEKVSDLLKQKGFRPEHYFDVDEITEFHRLTKTQLDDQFDPGKVQAAFQTPEISIDTFQIASALRDAIELHPRIEFRSQTEIKSVETTDDGNELVRVETSDAVDEAIKSDIVVNALWSDRLRLDAFKGLKPKQIFRFRHKLALHLRKATYPDSLNSTTLMLGPYGDLVTFPDNHIYLSWYPSCLQYTSDEIQPPQWDNWITDETRQRVRVEVFQEMSKRLPLISQINVAEDDLSIEGGTIFSWGNANISDPDDQVHERVDIGISSIGNYYSIDTGKYGMAPAFAEKMVEILDG